MIYSYIAVYARSGHLYIFTSLKHLIIAFEVQFYSGPFYAISHTLHVEPCTLDKNWNIVKQCFKISFFIRFTCFINFDMNIMTADGNNPAINLTTPELEPTFNLVQYNPSDACRLVLVLDTSGSMGVSGLLGLIVQECFKPNKRAKSRSIGVRDQFLLRHTYF